MVSRAYPDTQLLLSFYGDDVTGSTDALEAAALAGIPAVLFLAPPTKEQLRRYPGIRVVGVAGDSRSRSPAWMDANLPEIFTALKALGAPILHYKTCSTFDSAPEVGNIGRAIEIGMTLFGAPVPVVVGVLRHRRFVVFSNLFAAASVGGSQAVYRIDRHPSMSRHPITPMHEADLRLHLAQQTKRPVTGLDFHQLLAADAAERLDGDIVVFDTFDAVTARRSGELLADLAAKKPIFVAGSSGVEYALFDHLQAEERLPAPRPLPSCGPVDKIVAVYGSCSPISAAQIDWAEHNGMTVVAADTAGVVKNGAAAETVSVERMAAALSQSRGVVLCTARGPNDPRIAQTRQALEQTGRGAYESSRILGEHLGRVLRQTIEQTGIRRAVLAGGDSSSHAFSQLGIEALEVAAPLAPGAPLCRAHADDPRLDGLEIVLKGGQVGGPDFLGRLITGY